MNKCNYSVGKNIYLLRSFVRFCLSHRLITQKRAAPAFYCFVVLHYGPDDIYEGLAGDYTMSTDGSLFDGDGNELVLRKPPSMPRDCVVDNRIHSMKYDDMMLYMQQRQKNPVVDIQSGSQWFTAIVYVLREMTLHDPRMPQEAHPLHEAAAMSEEYVWPLPNTKKRPAQTGCYSHTTPESKRARLSNAGPSSAGLKHTNTQSKDKVNTNTLSKSVWDSHSVHASAVIGQQVCKIFKDKETRQPRSFLGKIYNVRALVPDDEILSKHPFTKLRPLDYFFLVRYNDGDREEINLTEIHKYILEPIHSLRLRQSSSRRDKHSGDPDIRDNNLRRCSFSLTPCPAFWTAGEMGSMVRAVEKHGQQWVHIKEDPEFADYFSCMLWVCMPRVIVSFRGCDL